MPRIPGLPGGSEPTFRTRDRRWLELDSLVLETRARLGEEGVQMTPTAIKAAIQMGRALLAHRQGLAGEALGEAVSDQLRGRRVLLPPAVAQRVLAAYAAVFLELEVEEVNEFGS